jgi:hypothetical protein
MPARRILILQDPFLHLNSDKPWRERGQWPCRWVGCPGAEHPPFVAAYRLRFMLEADATIRAHVSADERYELFLDGERIGRGPERGDPMNWFYETYDLTLLAGEHVIVARTWALGDTGADAQMSVMSGFLFAPEGGWTGALGTGLAAWEAKLLGGYRWGDKFPALWRAAALTMDGAEYPWGVERGEGDDWLPARTLLPARGRYIDWSSYRQHMLTPATLPPMLDTPVSGGVVRFVGALPSLNEASTVRVHLNEHLSDEADAWAGLLRGEGHVKVPPHTIRRAIIDLDNYYVAYPEVTVSGGAGGMVQVAWAESLYHNDDVMKPLKGNRDAVDGKLFIGRADTFLPDGGESRSFMPLWWQAGRYLQLVVQTGDAPLTLERFALRECRYPLEMESHLQADDPRIASILPMCIRAMQAASNETYFDSPYYEEMMYTGDTRLECLTTYIMTRDDRLPRKALRLYDSSRTASGLTQSRYPAHDTQVIAPFALWWVGMVYDYAMWRDDPEFVRSLMPGVRQTLLAFDRYMRPDGLLGAPPGWNTLDWVDGWEAGIPPGGVDGPSGLMNWQLVYTLNLASRLEWTFGERNLSPFWRKRAEALAEHASAAFWDEGRGLMADTLEHDQFSEHTQCFVILIQPTPEDESYNRMVDNLFTAPDLARTTIYFSHYYLDACRILGRMDAFMNRLHLWSELKQNGLRTTIEMPEPSRSDCHAWGAHPLYHYFVSVLGIRPAISGFRTISVHPRLGTLQHAAGTLVHPKGEIQAEFWQEDGETHGRVLLPNSTKGRLYLKGRKALLKGGEEFVF